MGMMPGTMGAVTPSLRRLFDETEVGIRVVEILRDGRVGARIHLALEVEHVVARRVRLRMELRIGRDFDVEVFAGLRADERHQFVGVLELADAAHAGRQVAAQRDDALDAHVFVGEQQRTDVVARRADAGQVRRGVVSFGVDQLDRLQRAVLCGAARAEGDGEEFRFDVLPDAGAQQ